MITSGISGSVSRLTDMQSIGSINKERFVMPQDKPPKPDIDAMVEKMSSELGLTDAQEAQLKSIFQDDFKSMESEFEKESTSANRTADGSRKADMKEHMDSLTEKIKSILTPEQLDKFNAFLEEMKSNIPVENQEGRLDSYI